MEQEAVHFGENRIIKSAFHKKPININEVDNKRKELSDKNHMIKIHLNTLLDIYFIMHKTSSNECACLYFDKDSNYMNHLVKDEKILKNI